MRSSKDFIELTGKINNKKYLINKKLIIYVTQDSENESAIIFVVDGDRTTRILVKESYKDVAEELFWFWACACVETKEENE